MTPGLGARATDAGAGGRSARGALVVWAAIYLTWGRSMRPGWRGYGFVVAVTLTWVVVTMTFNRIAGSNYGFLNAKPGTSSLLDVMGPWPWYVLVGAVLVAGIWAAMTWPWERGRGGHTPGPSECSSAS